MLDTEADGKVLGAQLSAEPRELNLELPRRVSRVFKLRKLFQCCVYSYRGKRGSVACEKNGKA